jgi:hypothetical protein
MGKEWAFELPAVEADVLAVKFLLRKFFRNDTQLGFSGNQQKS